MKALGAAVSRFPAAGPLGLEVTAAARAAAEESLARSGLLLGEMHGVTENPLLIRALMAEFGLSSLGLEWPDELTPVITAFLATGTLAGHDWLWLGDGRITAGHLAVLAAMAAAGPLDLVLFDGAGSPGEGWPERDAAMARRLLAAVPAGGAGTLVVAGNAHTPTTVTELGLPLGAHLARARARGQGDQDPLRQRGVLESRATPVRAASAWRGRGPGAAGRGGRRARARPAGGQRGDRAAAAAGHATAGPRVGPQPRPLVTFPARRVSGW
jgi:hypothetical protein